LGLVIKDSIRLPGVFIIRESITNTNNFSNKKKKIEIVYGHAHWDQGKLFDEKKTGDEQSRDTVPLRI
jgi:hypothetical protein